jgi:hypothetical protein
MTHTSEASVAAAPRPPVPSSAPIIVLFGPDGSFADRLSPLFLALGLQIVAVDSVPMLAATLHGSHPIAFACGLTGTGAAAACHAIKTVARYDISLPMLMVTDDDPETLGGLDAIVSLYEVSDVTRLTAPPRMEDVLAFVARAGRRSGRLALMPV